MLCEMCLFTNNRGYAELKNHPVLSILIPSYNQSIGLDATLANVIHGVEAGNHQQNVEVIVSDNCSSDDSWSVITKHLSGGLQAHRQEKNLGFTANIDYLARSANGTYIIFLGCGETFQEKWLDKLVEFLKRNTVSYLSLGTVGARPPKMANSTFAKTAIPLFVSGAFVPWYSEAISLNVMHRVSYMEVMGRPINFGDMWPHVERLLIIGSQTPASLRFSMRAPVIRFFDDRQGWATKVGSYKLALAHLQLIRVHCFAHGTQFGPWVKYMELTWLSVPRALVASRTMGLEFNKSVLNELRAAYGWHLIGLCWAAVALLLTARKPT
jgi:glycosyltransferase involved in cell wall biosynthesis